MHLPDPVDLDLDPVDLPRDAFFGPTEQITPYPPGSPAILPGERITKDVLDYLRTGAAGRDGPARPHLETLRVTAR
jgi:lysine decarboxylase